MEDSTLRPTPSYNANIPVVTSAGGTNNAYKDPNSPESILKKTTELNAQTAVDTKFDAAMSPYHEEGFQSKCGCHRCPMRGTTGCPMQGSNGCRCPYCRHSKDEKKRITNLQVLLFITIILFIAIVSLNKPTPAGRIFLLTLCIILIGLILNQWALPSQSKNLS